MSKASSRIPTFRSKGPQTKPKPALEITARDVGKKVRVVEKEGTLRYVGNVHFSSGVWCGVELTTSSGKNDGLVHGVRYFACPQSCGLMAPLSKVSLLEPYEEDGISGPYSMLFIDPKDDSGLEANGEVHKSCEDLHAVKRRRTFSKIEAEKPASLPQLKTSFDFVGFAALGKFSHSTPEESLLRKLQTSSTVDDDGSKRDSLELEESLGILTPEEMIDGLTFMSLINSRTPSFACINEIEEKKSDLPSPNAGCKSELPSPNMATNTDFSLGLMDEQILNNLTLRTDTTMNMELSLDKIDNFELARPEQTPSPEELPLDPTPIVESDPKTEPTKSKTSNSFVTSITSITSLDTGYQGDGEMSRPASRGADNSPLTRRPLPRPQTRRPDPMTDSDFYTESDADNHEENPLRGDRRAQVIDGTLYGGDPQANADLYANNRENMDSSGIFTDIESNTHNVTTDVSPSDTSTKTISGNSQNNLQEVLETTKGEDQQKGAQKENPKKRTAPSPATSSPSSVRSPRHAKEENASKKCKMPKRDVASKVKAMLQTSSESAQKKSSGKKPIGRWDAVMNKITKTETTKTNLKDVKSKVFTSVNVQTDVRKTLTRQATCQKSPNNKLRRIRARTGTNAASKSHVESSIHSSFSDLSASGAPPKAPAGSAKKRDVVQVTQVLTASKLSPRQNATAEINNKKTASGTPLNDPKSKRIASGLKDKKQISSKDCGRATVKGGRISPAVRPPVHPRVPQKPVPRVAEALAVLVQHLVFNVEAYQVPVLKKQVQRLRHEAEEVRLNYQHLEQSLLEERNNKRQSLDEERAKCAVEIADLLQEHKNQIAELNSNQNELERRMFEKYESDRNALVKQNEDKLLTLKAEFEKLQNTHEESLDILREENDAIREQIDEKNALLDDARRECCRIKEEHEAKEMKLKEQLQNSKCESYKLKQELGKVEEKWEEKLSALREENARLREENDRLLSYGHIKDKGISLQELQSLRVVLELKQNEVGDLRRALAEATQKNEALAAAEEKSAALAARCEDLQHQLQRKSELEQQLIQENKKLCDSFKEEMNQKKRLCQYNEELKWKLNQNKEIVSKVLEETNFTRCLLSSSFNERHLSSGKQHLERTLSFREQKNRSWKSRTEDLSPPSSPKVKGVVEKSDSVSYVLDLDESPEIVASRIVRSSFRNSTPPKTTPTKSPSNKRPRMKFPLSLSASASAILPSNRSNDVFDEEDTWATSTPKNNHQDDDLDLDEDEEDLKLPALPSEIGRKNGAQALPSPKHLAGEAMISESNSEDESTSSSSVQL